MGDEHNDPNAERKDDCDCSACTMRRMLQNAGLLPEQDEEMQGGRFAVIDVKQMLGQAISEMPDMMRMFAIADLIQTMCLAATMGELPEEDRGDPDAWDGHSPRDFFTSLASVLSESIPDGEMMANKWNEHLLHKAEEMVNSDEPLTVPETWVNNH